MAAFWAEAWLPRALAVHQLNENCFVFYQVLQVWRMNAPITIATCSRNGCSIRLCNLNIGLCSALDLVLLHKLETAFAHWPISHLPPTFSVPFQQEIQTISVTLVVTKPQLLKCSAMKHSQDALWHCAATWQTQQHSMRAYSQILGLISMELLTAKSCK